MISSISIRHIKKSCLTQQSFRNFSIVAPKATLHFINHPRYGSVYPIVSMNDNQQYFKTAISGCLGSSMLNTLITYSLFVQPFFSPLLTSIICNPLFILPSIALNYVMFARYYAYFFQPRSHVINMYLLPNGKQVIVETRDGESKVVNNMDFYDVQPVTTRYQHRIDFYHGANNYLFLRGNSYTYDSNMLGAVLCNNFVDIKNVAYDYDVTKEFTWDFKELVEIKKRKRIVNRFYKPTLSVLSRLQNTKKFETNKKEGALLTPRNPMKPYEAFHYYSDIYAEKKVQKKQDEKQELNVNYAGRKELKILEQKKKSKKEEIGRKVKRLEKNKILS